MRAIIAHSPQSFEIMGDAALTFEPFLDNDLIDFALKLPPPLRLCGTLDKRLIVERLPKVAGVIYGRTGHTLKNDLIISQNPILDRLDYLQRQIIKKVWPEKKRKMRVGNIPVVESIRGQSRSIVRSVLDQAQYLEDYFNAVESVHSIT